MVGGWFAIVFAYWNGHYFVPGAVFAFALGLLLLVPLILIALGRIEEIAAVAFGRGPRRLIASPPLAPEAPFAPKVSIHIPAYMEPPEMLKATLDSVARLDYPNLECVIVINNTPDPAFWLPVEEHCRVLGERFKFVREDNLHGFKAGALRLALAHTSPDAEIIGVLDADYVVHPDWLKDMVPAFADTKVGLVQAPQDHRDGERSVMHHAMNGEYAGFFDIGMVQRNEANAIIVHGTMCLIRRTALAQAGGWSSDTIVEDTDLGLTILEQGWLAHYTNKRYGHGLLPDNYPAVQAAASPLGLRRLPDREEALAVLPAGREPPHPRAKARVHAGLAELARRREPRRGGRAAQSDLRAVRRVRRHRDAGQDADDSDPGGLRGVGRAFRGALPAAGENPGGSGAWRRVRSDVSAMDGGAGGRLRPDQGQPAVRAHGQGR